MPLQFRNLNVTPDDPVESWGVTGVSTAIDRGGLSHWRRIIAAVERDPFGEVAADVEEAVTFTESPGVTALMKRALARARAGQSLSAVTLGEDQQV